MQICCMFSWGLGAMIVIRNRPVNWWQGKVGILIRLSDIRLWIRRRSGECGVYYCFLSVVHVLITAGDLSKSVYVPCAYLGELVQ